MASRFSVFSGQTHKKKIEYGLSQDIPDYGLSPHNITSAQGLPLHLTKAERHTMISFELWSINNEWIHTAARTESNQ